LVSANKITGFRTGKAVSINVNYYLSCVVRLLIITSIKSWKE